MNMHQSGELEMVLEDAGVLVPIDEEESTRPENTGQTVVGQDTASEIGVTQAEASGSQTHKVK